MQVRIAFILVIGVFSFFIEQFYRTTGRVWEVIHDRSVIRVKPDPEVRILAFSFISASIARSCLRAKLEMESSGGLVAVQGAGSSRSWTFHDMEVDHGGGDVGMAEKVLDSAG